MNAATVAGSVVAVEPGSPQHRVFVIHNPPSRPAGTRVGERRLAVPEVIASAAVCVVRRVLGAARRSSGHRGRDD